jgi:fermentation-respiration switch protein FrsA (DUF1100 family)
LSSGDFGWWHEGFRGWERTGDWMIRLMSAQHFDGMFGFSQGAALAGLLAALREDEPAPIFFDLAIMVRAFTSTMSQHAQLFTRKLSVPSLHVIGRADGIIPMGESLLLGRAFHGTGDHRARWRARHSRRPGDHDADRRLRGAS